MWASHPLCDPRTVLHYGQAHFLKPPIISITGSSNPAPGFFFTGDGEGDSIASLSCCPTSISDGGGGGGIITVSVVFPFSCHRSCGKSPGPASSTTSLNNFHPWATVLCPSATIWWPATTFLTDTTKKARSLKALCRAVFVLYFRCLNEFLLYFYKGFNFYGFYIALTSHLNIVYI